MIYHIYLDNSKFVVFFNSIYFLKQTFIIYNNESRNYINKIVNNLSAEEQFWWFFFVYYGRDKLWKKKCLLEREYQSFVIKKYLVSNL